MTIGWLGVVLSHALKRDLEQPACHKTKARTTTDPRHGGQAFYSSALADSLRTAHVRMRCSDSHDGEQIGDLVEEHGVVEGVALDGFEAGVADDTAEFLFGGAVAGAGSFDHVLFEHDGAYIVAAEVEA